MMKSTFETLAERVLRNLKFTNIKFIDGHFDFRAIEKDVLVAIEVKGSSFLNPKQMKALAKAREWGGTSYLLVVDDQENYCLFKLHKTNLGKRRKPRKLVGMIRFNDEATLWGF